MATQFQKNHLELLRYFGTHAFTVGVLLSQGRGMCFTLEDPFQATKIKGVTRIPQGLYELELKAPGESRFDTAKFNEAVAKYRGMIRLRDVPNFSEVLVHPGNRTADTAGCILVGMSPNILNGSMAFSTVAYQVFYNTYAPLLDQKEKVSIHIRDMDRHPSAADSALIS